MQFSKTSPLKSGESSEKSRGENRVKSCHVCGCHLGKRKHTPPCSSAELFFAEKNGVHRGKLSVVDMVFLVFIGFLYPPLAWKVFLCSQKSSPKIFFRWWSCTPFSSLCFQINSVKTYRYRYRSVIISN